MFGVRWVAEIKAGCQSSAKDVTGSKVVRQAIGRLGGHGSFITAYLGLAWSFLVEFAGGAVRTSHWLLDTSVFSRITPAPATSPDWPSAAVITGLAVLAAALGGLLSRRDLKNA